ncbi:MAG: bifunctional tRNA (5-methylaminomethyl-2-thiouridine)(34)-methyltransferase MnmD/FAD-dependent 5-carboxymethylaminomethyl-2-thiouridine(34) oxidoreductase MnmC [Methylophilaceae bacterium]|nr:bifunctional tRNA (5-methylaminomethyl-2-thiouridine)(34)-methyltransferase MnmD/FAD-dependent 5-carboxymethylaminomethyl-2-thiouridine(34) oxidoreductase MnmC [Methylophilaceae bacterium]
MTDQNAKLSWQDGQPHSLQFDDIYFSSDSGLDETTHVFLTHNHLPARWKTMQARLFSIVETGFGTGLNFLCAWQLWQQCAPVSARLHFISTEKFPLTLADLKQALDFWPQLAEQRDALLAQYQWLTPGFQRLTFEDGRVTLTLLIGDICETLPQLRAKVDAWFLDGFSPAKNPEMWQPSLFEQMAKLSHAETTFATFTSAGIVRRGLEAAGFCVKKVAGFGRKREMLCGHYEKIAPATAASATTAPTEQHAIVIGGGMAGCASAHALACRGWQVTLIERHATLAAEASGNPVGVLYPRLAIKETAQSRLSLHGYLHTLRLLQSLAQSAEVFNACGLLQLGFDARELERCIAIAGKNLPQALVRLVEQAEASTLAGVSLKQAGLYFSAAGCINPAALCQALANHGNIHLLASSQAIRLIKDAAQWQVWSHDKLLAAAPVLVIAGANETASFEQTRHLPLSPVRGQITLVNASTASRQLKTVLCTDGYLSPQVAGLHCLGATFSPNETSTEIRGQDHLDNFAMLQRMVPALQQSLVNQAIFGRAGIRCTTSDYLPLAGALLDASALSVNLPKHPMSTGELPWLAGLYVNTGHGSKGLITAPLCAEIIAGMICGEPAPVASNLLAAINPNRFLLRKLGLKKWVSVMPN